MFIACPVAAQPAQNQRLAALLASVVAKPAVRHFMATETRKRRVETMTTSQSILYSAGSNDECLTPAYGVEPIIKYIPDGWVVWCPFDKPDSWFVRLISRTHQVIRSHIDDGQDFYTYEPDQPWDCIISNPPFTKKRQIFERALSFYKPFGLLMTNVWLNDSAPMQLFADRDLQLLMFEQRIKYENDGVVNNKITFKSSYYCWNFLPKQIIMESLRIPKPVDERQTRFDIQTLL